MTINRKRAGELLTKFRQRRILVVGDLMLDRYIFGSVNRISPEAPVPVVHVQNEKTVPGGASNVALNIGSLLGKSGVAGVTGSDHEGSEISDLLTQRGVAVNAIISDASIRTTVKTRVIADRQQIVRIDWEDVFHYSDATLTEFRQRLLDEISRADGVILEDYGKGVVVQDVVDIVLKAASERKIPVGLDPKENHTLNVAGITLATPNRKEAFSGAGVPESRPAANPLEDKSLLKVGEILLQKWKPELLMITLGAQGMLLLERGKDPYHVPTRAREVFDVSGAGDTVIGTCVLARAAGASFIEAAEIANYAAGVVVGKLGTATCSPEELIAWVPENV
jgi:D-beta-D-heptose 7-phosphate kinase/D-beta-D-heptose 1-phosphate adenosyltransferase